MTIPYEKTRLTLPQKNKVLKLLKQYDIDGDRLIFRIIRELNISLMMIEMLFDEKDRQQDILSIKRDNNRIKKIFELINEIENTGLRFDLTNGFSPFTPMVKHSYHLPAIDELNRFLVQACSALATVLTNRNYFKRAKETELYPFLFELVNILSPGSFKGDVIADAHEKAFKKFLCRSYPSRPRKGKA